MFLLEIYRFVKNGQTPCFRPTLANFSCAAADDDEGIVAGPDEELVVMVGRCWSEEPLERPEFHSLKTTLKRINK